MNTSTVGRSRLSWLAVMALSVLAMCLTGCDSLSKYMTDSSGRPEIRFKAARITNLTLADATLAFDVEVTNPYPIPLPISNLEYRLSSGDAHLLDGTSSSAGIIDANSAKVITLPASIKFEPLIKVMSGITPGQLLPYTADFKASVEPKELGRIELPLRHEGKVPIPAVPQITLKQITWDKLSLDEAVARLDVRVVNTNKFPVDLKKMSYALSLGDTEVGKVSSSDVVKFGAERDASLSMPVSFSPKQLGLAFFNMLTGKKAGYRMAGSLDLDSQYAPMTLPFEKRGETSLVGK